MKLSSRLGKIEGMLTYFKKCPHNEREEMSIVGVEDEIIELSSDTNQTIKRTPEESLDLGLSYGETLNKLPLKYKEKVLRGESFEIEVIKREYIIYTNKAAEKERS